MNKVCWQPCFSGMTSMVDASSCTPAIAQKDAYKNFDQFVARYQKKAFLIAFDMVNDVEDAKDLSQEAFARTYERLDKFRGESSLYTWFYRILVNLCMDFRRQKRRWWKIFQPEEDSKERPRSSIADKPSSAPDPIEVYEQKTLAQEVRRAIEGLSSKQRAVFILRNYHGMPIREIAVILKMAEGTVKSHLFRAVRELQTRLKDNYRYDL